MQQKIDIKSTHSEYQVLFTPDIFTLQNLLTDLSLSRHAAAILDENIHLYYPELTDFFRKKQLPVLLMPAAEENKTLAGSEKVLAFLAENQAVKSTAVIAIGGGIIQDIVSFAAHIYYRGLDFIYVPSTLLSMSDSCIGAKCGLNYLGFKNQLGAFHPPKTVLICPEFIKTLSEQDLSSGYGEIFKLALISDQTAYSYLTLKKTLDQYGFKNKAIPEHIFHSLMIKKDFIEKDEFDTGIRRILNYGHSFGHALELASDYKIPHGAAVARGIDIANFIACQLNLLDKNIYSDIHDFINKYFPETLPPNITARELIINTKKDKKINKNKLNMILLEKPGVLTMREIEFDARLEGILNIYLAEHAKFDNNTG